MSQFDLLGIGSPIMDLLAPVPDSFLAHAGGEKGGMVLVDDAEMHRILSHLEISPATSTGGSAANATFNAARLGLRTAFLGKLGNDSLADAYRRSFAAAGVDTSRFKRADLPNARSLILVTPDAQRTMRTSLGPAMTLSPDEISPDDFAGFRHAHIEGYLVFNQALIDRVLSCARTAGCTVSMDLASFEVINATRDWIFSQLHKGIDVVFANEDEIRALYQDRNSDYAKLAQRLASTGVLAAVKMGKDGAWLAHGNELHHVAPVVVSDVIDTNGAGDAWAAGFLTGFLRDLPLPKCGELASLIGAETVRHLGPIIPASAWPAFHARAQALAS